MGELEELKGLQMRCLDSNDHQPMEKFCSLCEFCLAPQASTTKIPLAWSPCSQDIVVDSSAVVLQGGFGDVMASK